MKLLTDINQYYALMNQAKATHKTVRPMYSNCYLIIDIVEQYIREKQLYVMLLPNGLLLLQDKGRFYKLYMQIAELVPFAIPKTEKPLVTELVFRQDNPVEGQDEVEKLLTLSGMTRYREMREFSIGNISPAEKNRCEQGLESLQQQSFRFEPVTMQTAAEAYELLGRNIDRYDLYGFQEMNWPNLCEKELAFCTVAPQGKICAVCVVPKGFRGGLEAVDAQYRGLGLGYAIKFYSYFVQGKANATDHLWIDSTNSVNLHLTQKMGGIDSLRRTRSYVWDPQVSKEICT